MNPFVSRLDDVTAEAVTRCLATGFAVSVVHTEAPGHATALAREAAEAGYDLVAAVGGDGTVSEARRVRGAARGQLTSSKSAGSSRRTRSKYSRM